MDESTLIATDNEVGRERFEAVIRSVPDAIVVIDSRGAIDLLNPAAEELFGYGSGDAVGRPCRRAAGGLPSGRVRGVHAQHARREMVPAIGRHEAGDRPQGRRLRLRDGADDHRPAPDGTADARGRGARHARAPARRGRDQGARGPRSRDGPDRPGLLRARPHATHPVLRALRRGRLGDRAGDRQLRSRGRRPGPHRRQRGARSDRRAAAGPPARHRRDRGGRRGRVRDPRPRRRAPSAPPRSRASSSSW